MARQHIYLPTHVSDALRKATKESGFSRSSIVRHYVQNGLRKDGYLDRSNQRAKESSGSSGSGD